MPELQSSQWFAGPSFLLQDENDWPVEDYVDVEEVLSTDPEVNTELVCMAALTSTTPDIRGALLDITRFSRWSVAIGTAATIRRWSSARRHEEFNAEELRVAEHDWMKLVQQDTLSQELADLRAARPVRSTSHIFNLSPVLVDDLICVDTRLIRSPDISATAKFPPILL